MNKGDIFIPMVQHPFVMAVFERILGDDFALGSIATNTLLPGTVTRDAPCDMWVTDVHVQGRRGKSRTLTIRTGTTTTASTGRCSPRRSARPSS